jgi:hypothetical protein
MVGREIRTIGFMLRSFNTGKVKDGRGDVFELNETCFLSGALNPRTGDDQVHSYTGVVVALRLAVESVVKEQLPVVGEKQERGALRVPIVAYCSQYPAELLIQVSQICKVQTTLVRMV